LLQHEPFRLKVNNRGKCLLPEAGYYSFLKLKIMKKIKSLGKQLSKNEQKHFSGGVRDDGGSGGAYCLYCWGQGGACGSGIAESRWPRSTNGDAEAACAIVYSGCDLHSGFFTDGPCGGGGGLT
jgi:hypothetical protein